MQKNERIIIQINILYSLIFQFYNIKYRITQNRIRKKEKDRDNLKKVLIIWDPNINSSSKSKKKQKKDHFIINNLFNNLY